MKSSNMLNVSDCILLRWRIKPRPQQTMHSKYLRMPSYKGLHRVLFYIILVYFFKKTVNLVIFLIY